MRYLINLLLFITVIFTGHAETENSLFIDKIGLETVRNIRECLHKNKVFSYNTRLVVGSTFCEISLMPEPDPSSKLWIQSYRDPIIESLQHLSPLETPFDFYIGIHSPYTDLVVWYEIVYQSSVKSGGTISEPIFISGAYALVTIGDPEYTVSASEFGYSGYGGYDDFNDFSACFVCGGGNIYTKYGKKSHAYGCQYTRHGMRNNTLKNTNTRKRPSSTPSLTGKTIRVRGYYRKDGTYVKPHTRRR